MAGTSMNAVASFMKDAIQTQQNSLMQGLASTAASSAESGAGFGEYMKNSVSTAEESYKSVEEAVEAKKKAKVSAQETAKTAEVTGAANKGKNMVKENTVEQTTATDKENVLINEGTEDCQKSAEKGFSQQIQELLGKTENAIELPEDLKEALAKLEEQLMQKIMESFEVTEDEVKEAMEVLAINIYDLLQTDNLKELAVYVSDEESLVALVTNADMYNAYKEAVTGIEEIAASFMDEFSVTPEELQEIMTQLKNVKVDSTIKNVDSVNMENVLQEQMMVTGQEQSEKTAEVEVQTETKEPQIVVEVSKTMESAEKEKADNKMPLQENGDIQLKEKTVETATEDSASQQQNNFASASESEVGEKKTTAKQNENAVSQMNTSYATVVTENEVQTVVRTQKTDFEGIVRQIVEQIKVEIKPDVSSMELQLNPENLGKVNLHVSSKEGVITAQFFVQNETVKAMMEGQLMVLREAMNEQGVKVEAVEVTVETGQFGRSLEQHSEQQKQEAEKQAKSYQHKAINLLEGFDEETLNEEELLRAHIMRESGNSVDMNA